MSDNTKDSIKGGLLLALVVASMFYAAYLFGTGLKRQIIAKEYNDSLKLENLKLEIEVKKKILNSSH